MSTPHPWWVYQIVMKTRETCEKWHINMKRQSLGKSERRGTDKELEEGEVGDLGRRGRKKSCSPHGDGRAQERAGTAVKLGQWELGALRAVQWGIGLDHGQIMNREHLRFTRGIWKSRWLNKARAPDTAKAPGHQLVGAAHNRHLMGVLGNLVAKVRIPGQEPGAWVWGWSRPCRWCLVGRRGGWMSMFTGCCLYHGVRALVPWNLGTSSLSVLALAHVILTVTLGGGPCHYPHFTGGDTESERRKDLSRAVQQARGNIKVQTSTSAEPPPGHFLLKEVMPWCFGHQEAIAVLWWGERHDEKEMTNTVVIQLNWQIFSWRCHGLLVFLFWQKFIFHANHIILHTLMRCVNEWKLQRISVLRETVEFSYRLSKFHFGSWPSYASRQHGISSPPTLGLKFCKLLGWLCLVPELSSESTSTSASPPTANFWRRAYQPQRNPICCPSYTGQSWINSSAGKPWPPE